MVIIPPGSRSPVPVSNFDSALPTEQSSELRDRNRPTEQSEGQAGNFPQSNLEGAGTETSHIAIWRARARKLPKEQSEGWARKLPTEHGLAWNLSKKQLSSLAARAARFIIHIFFFLFKI